MAFLSRHKIIIIFLLCMLVPVPFWLIGQIEFIYRIVAIYFLVGSLLWGLLFIFVGIREWRKKLPDSEKWSRTYIWFGLLIMVLLPGLFIGINRIWDLWGNNPLAPTSVFYVDLFKLASTYVLIVFLLFLEIKFTPALIRTLLRIERLYPPQQISNGGEENTA